MTKRTQHTKRTTGTLRSSARRVSRHGFTLLELMASLIAGLVAIAAVYTLGAGSTRHFQEQQRIASTQTSLRMAMEQIRADLERAGLYGIASTTTASAIVVPPSGFSFQALTARENPYATVIDPSGLNLSQGDGLILVGNYSTTGSYLVSGVRPGGTVTFQESWQGFRRDFGAREITAGQQFAYSDSAFDAAFFMAGSGVTRVLHLVTPQNAHFFPQITASNGAGTPATISVTGLTIGGSNPLATGFLEGSIAAPLTCIEYAIVNANDAASGLAAITRTNAAGAASEGTHAVLVRREVTFGDFTPIPNTTRVVLEFVADFNIDYVLDSALVTPLTNAAPNLVRVTGAQTQQATNFPWQVQSAIVRLSARTPLVDPKFEYIRRNSVNEPLTRFTIKTPGVTTVSDMLDHPGAAHVRSLTSEIRTPNIR